MKEEEDEIILKITSRLLVTVLIFEFLLIMLCFFSKNVLIDIFKIDNELIEKFGVDSGTASNMVNNFNFIKEVKAWAFISYDTKNKVYKVNIRSRGPVINEIAAKYNGGGHAFASGVRTPNEEDIDNLIKDLDEVCKEEK